MIDPPNLFSVADEPLPGEPLSAEPSSDDSASNHTPAVAAGQPIVVYTDGACRGNPGPGGWGWAHAPDGVPNGSGGEPATTNQRMELTAVIEALRSLGLDDVSAGDEPHRPIEVVSDSTYVVNCFRDGWWKNWQRNGWQNSKKQPVANDDLWRVLIELVQAGTVTFRWVKGHSGHPMNELVDQLAVAATPGN